MQPIRAYRLNNSVPHSSSEMIFVISEMQVISSYNTIDLRARSWFFCTRRTYLYISVLWLVRRNLGSSSAFHHRVLTVRIAAERPSIRSLDSQSIRPQGLKKILLVWYQNQSLRRIGQSENKKYYIKVKTKYNSYETVIKMSWPHMSCQPRNRPCTQLLNIMHHVLSVSFSCLYWHN